MLIRITSIVIFAIAAHAEWCQPNGGELFDIPPITAPREPCPDNDIAKYDCLPAGIALCCTNDPENPTECDAINVIPYLQRYDSCVRNYQRIGAAAVANAQASCNCQGVLCNALSTDIFRRHVPFSDIEKLRGDFCYKTVLSGVETTPKSDLKTQVYDVYAELKRDFDRSGLTSCTSRTRSPLQNACEENIDANSNVCAASNRFINLDRCIRSGSPDSFQCDNAPLGDNITQSEDNQSTDNELPPADNELDNNDPTTSTRSQVRTPNEFTTTTTDRTKSISSQERETQETTSTNDAATTQNPETTIAEQTTEREPWGLSTPLPSQTPLEISSESSTTSTSTSAIISTSMTEILPLNTATTANEETFGTTSELTVLPVETTINNPVTMTMTNLTVTNLTTTTTNDDGIVSGVETDISIASSPQSSTNQIGTSVLVTSSSDTVFQSTTEISPSINITTIIEPTPDVTVTNESSQPPLSGIDELPVETLTGDDLPPLETTEVDWWSLVTEGDLKSITANESTQTIEISSQVLTTAVEPTAIDNPNDDNSSKDVSDDSKVPPNDNGGTNTEDSETSKNLPSEVEIGTNPVGTDASTKEEPKQPKGTEGMNAQQVGDNDSETKGDTADVVEEQIEGDDTKKDGENGGSAEKTGEGTSESTDIIGGQIDQNFIKNAGNPLGESPKDSDPDEDKEPLIPGGISDLTISSTPEGIRLQNIISALPENNPDAAANYDRNAVANLPNGLPIIVAKLNIACAQICTDKGGLARQKFIQQLNDDLVNSLKEEKLKATADTIGILNLVDYDGGTVFQFTIYPLEDGTGSDVGVRAYKRQLDNPNSYLRRLGILTRNIDPSVFGIDVSSSVSNDALYASSKLPVTAIVFISIGAYLVIMAIFVFAYRRYVSRVKEDELNAKMRNESMRSWYYKSLKINPSSDLTSEDIENPTYSHASLDGFSKLDSALYSSEAITDSQVSTPAERFTMNTSPKTSGFFSRVTNTNFSSKIFGSNRPTTGTESAFDPQEDDYSDIVASEIDQDFWDPDLQQEFMKNSSMNTYHQHTHLNGPNRYSNGFYM